MPAKKKAAQSVQRKERKNAQSVQRRENDSDQSTQGRAMDTALSTQRKENDTVQSTRRSETDTAQSIMRIGRYTAQSIQRRKCLVIIAGLCTTIVIIGIIIIACCIFMLNTNLAEQQFLVQKYRRCSFRRMLFGTVNDDFKQYHKYMGVYVKVGDFRLAGKPHYKHEFHNVYMYFSYIYRSWVVGNYRPWYSGEVVYMRVKSNAVYPNQISGKWSARNADNSSSSWVNQEHLVAVCVHDNFKTCQSGSVKLSKISSRNQNKVIGVYSMVNKYHDMRPIYWNNIAKAYLYHSGGKWVVSKTPLYYGHHNRHTLYYANDLALRAEFIAWDWYTGPMTMYAVDIKLTCSNQPAMVPTHKCMPQFHYRSFIFIGCTTMGNRLPWCSHTNVYNGEWDYCVPAVSLHPNCVSEFKPKQGDKVYTGCTRATPRGRNGYWCSVTSVLSSDYEFCVSTAIKPEEDCYFPFTYKGKVYRSCTGVDARFPWCATTQNFSHHNWEYCINIASRPHNKCKFPFEYKGKWYENCLISWRGNYWCSTTRTYTGDWQFCKGMPENKND